MAFPGGIGVGVERDVLINEIPFALKDPAYLWCAPDGVVGLAIYRYADSRE